MKTISTSEAAGREISPRRGIIAAWVVYDIGTTMFYAGVAGLFFPLWITGDLGGDDATMGFTISIAMALMLVVAPFVGAVSDHARRRMPFLIVSTIIGILAVLLLGSSHNMTFVLSLFAIALVAMNTSNIFYAALLTEVTTEESRGKVSGIGVGIGYTGAVIVVATSLIFVERWGYEFGFRFVAVMIALLALPLFVTLRERPRPVYATTVTSRMRLAVVDLVNIARALPQFRDLARFLLARFWYSWGINTAAYFAVLYATDTVGLSEFHTQLILLLGILVAIPSGVIWGVVADRLGPYRTMNIILVGWLFSLVASASIPSFGLPTALWWVVGVVSGIMVAGVWATDRPFMLRLSPPRYMGQLLGLSSMTGRLAGIVGPFMWGYIAVTWGAGQTAAVISLAVCIAISMVLLRGINDVQRTDEDVEAIVVGGN